MRGYAEDYMEGDILTEATTTAVERLFAALNARDVDAVMALMTPDCLLEAPIPLPDGASITGQEDVRAYWETFFRDAPEAAFEIEDSVAAADACAVRFVLRGSASAAGHVRAAALLRVRSGRVYEARLYAKSDRI